MTKRTTYKIKEFKMIYKIFYKEEEAELWIADMYKFGVIFFFKKNK